MTGKLNRWPARLDQLQSLSGLLLVVFIWGHMFFESSILLGMESMHWVSRMLKLALCVSCGALQRTESRGAHYRLSGGLPPPRRSAMDETHPGPLAR